jgi:hypothetical protein
MHIIQTKRYRSQFFVRLILICLLVFSFTAAAATGANFVNSSPTEQQSITGEWLADFNRKNPDEVQFTILRRNLRGGQSNSSRGILLRELQGLTREQAFGAKTDVNFRIVREAGTFQCKGIFREGRGTGFWTLTPNPNFISAMASRGYATLTEDELFSAALHNLNTKTIDDLKAAGYDRLTFKELVEASIFNVTGNFIREMRSAGYENLTIKQLVEARIFDVDSQFIKEAQAMGLSSAQLPLKSLVEMRIHKITPEFISQMRSLGFENLSFKELTNLKIHNITPEFVSGIKAEGFAQISPRQAVELKIHGVDRDFIRRVKSKGFADVTLKQLVNLRVHNIVQ